jgi:uncharacterized membrane protein
MSIGPVQLIVLGFNHPNFQGEIREELERLRDSDLVRVIDFLAVRKDAAGNLTKLHESQVSIEEAAKFGALVGALVGFGAAGDEGAVAGAEIGAAVVQDRGSVFDDDGWDALAEIPEDTAAALVLLEHRWAIPLRDALARAGGMRLASEFISPLDLVAVGLVKAEEAEALAAAEADAL